MNEIEKLLASLGIDPVTEEDVKVVKALAEGHEIYKSPYRGWEGDEWHERRIVKA